MQRCFNSHKKDFWECTTSNLELYTCTCCNKRANEICRPRQFWHAFNLEPIKTYSRAELAILSGFTPSEELLNAEAGNKQIERADHLFEECSKHNVLPFWCMTYSGSQNETTCGCNQEDGVDKVAQQKFDSAQVWNVHSCEITKEHHQILNTRYLANVYLGLFIVFVIFMILCFIGYFFFKRKYKKLLRSDDEDNIILE